MEGITSCDFRYAFATYQNAHFRIGRQVVVPKTIHSLLQFVHVSLTLAYLNLDWLCPGSEHRRDCLVLIARDGLA